MILIFELFFVIGLMLWFLAGMRFYQIHQFKTFLVHLLLFILLLIVSWYFTFSDQPPCNKILCGLGVLLSFLIVSLIGMISWSTILFFVGNNRYKKEQHRSKD